MAQGPCACDRLAVAEPGQDSGRRQGLRQLQLSIAIEPEEAGPVGIGLKESRYVAETGVRVPPPQIEPGDDLVGEGVRALPRQGEAAVDMAVLKERQGRGVALPVRLRQSFRRPRGGRAGAEDRKRTR